MSRQFPSLQAYVRLLGQCIGTVERGEASSAMQQVKQWGRECGLLLVATAFSSPKALGDVYHCKFDEGRVVRTDQPDSFFTSLLVRPVLFYPALVQLGQ